METIVADPNGTAKAPAKTTKRKAPPAPSASAPILVQRLRKEIIDVEIRGLTPIIPQRWAEKAIAQMRRKQMQPSAAVDALPPKDPDEEARQATYWLPDGRPGMPATAFKAAMVGACRFYDEPPMTLAKLLFWVEGEGPEDLVPIECDAIEQREDLPRNANGNPDLRYRNQLVGWRATLRIRFVASRISRESVVALLDAAGSGGVGSWRPSAPKSSTGIYGTWEVVTAE